MAGQQGPTTGRSRIDLDTVRETLTYMHGDMASTPDLARVHQALGRVLDEIAAVAPVETGERRFGAAKVVSIRGPRFRPWSPPGAR